MNWDAIAAVGEILSALAVVGTLIYLARQIRDQNAATALSAQESVFDGFNQVNGYLATNRELNELFQTGLNSPDSLNFIAASQFSWLFRLYVNQFMKMHQMYVGGVLPIDQYIYHAKQAGVLLSTAGGKVWRQAEGGSFPEFYGFIEKYTTEDTVISFSLGRDFDKDPSL